MLLKRRTPPSWFEKLRIWIWPRRSWFRSGQYVTKRILRLTASPHAVAAGVAAGVFTSFTPFIGFHFLLAFVFAWLIRGNFIAAALGTFFGNPLTFPFIWAATYKTGQFVLQTRIENSEPPALGAATADVLQAIANFDYSAAIVALDHIWTPILYPMMIGGMIVGPLFAIPVYFLTRRAAVLFRESRRKKLMQKATEMRDKAAKLTENASISGKLENV